MAILVSQLADKLVITDNLEKDAYGFLRCFDCVHTEIHSCNVVKEAKNLAERFGYDSKQAIIAGAFHDISGIIPNDQRLDFAISNRIDILLEEEALPLLLHQKISRFIACEIFGIKDGIILDAIVCHTTLRSNATPIDLIVFIADKLQWDQEGIPPYIQQVKAGLEVSLKHGAYAYISYLLQNSRFLKVVHPWLMDAEKDLKAMVGL